MGADLYLRVREKEGRLYSDEVVAKLPDVSPDHPLRVEWQARSVSAARLVKYLARLPRPLTILELGCGNGWLSNRMAGAPDCRVMGLDWNVFELAQAARIFAGNHRLLFVHADIFCMPIPAHSIDLVIIASALQYFHDAVALIQYLSPFLTARGEVHILDSPLYTSAELPAARERTRLYYERLGFPQMAAHYHHHLWDSLKPFHPIRLYDPQSWEARLRRAGGALDSPFPWLKISARAISG